MAAGSISVTTPENSKPIEDVVNSIFEQAFPGQSAITVMADAKIQLDADKLKLLAETYKSSNSTYLNFTAKDEGSALVKDMNSVGGKAAFIFIVKDKYCLTKELVGEKGTYWCIDNSGYAGVSTNCTKKTYSCK
jgi:DsbC/DsbD-like thiol-disulfide interchange protein